jgi:outer membrane lipoprotein-sorting protein
MKKIFFLLLIMSVLFSCKSKKVTVNSSAAKRYDTISEAKYSEVKSIKTKRAYELGKRLLETCNNSRFKSFNSSEATESVIKNATVEKVSKTCQKINLRNGKFLDLNLIDIIHDKATDDYIYRYDIKYQKKFYQRELRIVVNSDDKVSAISTKELAKKPM